MSGQIDCQNALFSYLSAEARIPVDQPLRAIKVHADAVLRIALHPIRSNRLF